jgi:hypothetical protein
MSVRRPQSDVIAKLKRNMVLGKFAPAPDAREHDGERLWAVMGSYGYDETPSERAQRLKRNAARVKRRNK